MKALNIVVLVLLVTVVTAKRGWRKPNKGLRCKYIKGEWADCDTTTNTVTRILTLRHGEDGCEKTQNQTISCLKYERIKKWKAEKMEQRKEMMKRKQEIKERHKILKEQRKRCNYDYAEWSDCDPRTYTVQRVLTLKGEQEGCEQTQTISIPCRKLNKIRKWKTIKTERKQKRREEKLQRKQERKEKRQEMKEQRLSCKYDKGNWSDCDTNTNTVQRVLTLRDGEDWCEPTMNVTISCTRYKRIQAWKAKKMERKNERRNGILIRKEEKNMLKENRKIMKKQRKLGCSFDVAISECDPTTNMVTKTYKPITSDDETCEKRSVAYSCDMHNRLIAKKMKRRDKIIQKKKPGKFWYQNYRF